MSVPEYNPMKHMEAQFLMQRLMNKWNLLDTCPDTGEYTYGTDERRKYLRDMTPFAVGYCNPYGEDDREHFSNVFYELLPSEQKNFLRICHESLQGNRPIYEIEIENLFRERPELLYIDETQQESKQNGKKSYRDGSERYPFLSLEEARTVSSCEELHLKCKSTCIKKKCPVPNCDAELCAEHGTGFVYLSEDEEHYLPRRSDKCFDCDTMFCENHFAIRLRKCPACVKLDEVIGCDIHFLCKGKCGQICGKINEDGDYDEHGQEPKCELICCKRCLEEDHACFIDEYPDIYDY
ncbi:predicted protein [Chaetoceros tenuissimus]|uniref:Uncharacterized protein n=1 Tax=Chaetoceros tenuissimus TaxID=426638 RepID=A0AAD3CLQ7_9STRA|nr:predicted protein [Chaetoceros tenuissimus]